MPFNNRAIHFDPAEEAPINGLLGASITYRTATGPRDGHKVFTLQLLPERPSARSVPQALTRQEAVA